MDLRTEIVRSVEALPVERHGEVLAFVNSLGPALPPGTPGSRLLRFAGVLDDVSAKEMGEAIEEGCERIDLSEWQIST